jgi:signal transduction histidine kinase
MLRRLSEERLGRALGLPNDRDVRLSPEDFHATPSVATPLVAIIGVMRWGAIMIGLPFAAQQAASGAVAVVLTLAIAIFLTSWRTVSPLRLGDSSKTARFTALFDVAVLSAALGLQDGFGNPMVGASLLAVAVVAFGWGLPLGTLAAAVALGATTSVFYFGGDNFEAPSSLAVFTLFGAAILPGMVLERLLDVEARRRNLADDHDRLLETNQLLSALNDLTLSLPSSLDQADVISRARHELTDTFDAKRLAVLLYEDGRYATLVQDGFELPPEFAFSELPPLFQLCAQSPTPIQIGDLAQQSARHGSGIYVRLVVDHTDLGLLALEHDQPHRYRPTDVQLLVGMAEVLGLTLANARSFTKLRSLAAAEERSRIARDLHDRLGQYLTYIAMELERINGLEDLHGEPSTAVKGLQEDVQSAVGEFRDTLLELRAAVSDERPLAVTLEDVVGRFAKRSKVQVTLDVTDRSQHLPARVENELLRICQEALTNVEKHAAAQNVHIRWTVADGHGVLLIQDDGRGFNPAHGIRGNAYGLVGMRERAASVGAVLSISSEEGEGTSITVQSSQHPHR